MTLDNPRPVTEAQLILSNSRQKLNEINAAYPKVSTTAPEFSIDQLCRGSALLWSTVTMMMTIIGGERAIAHYLVRASERKLRSFLPTAALVSPRPLAPWSSR
jgi:hypothetical protein